MNRLRFVAKSLVHGAMDWTGRPGRLRQQLRGTLAILTYHSFSTHWPRGLFNSLPVDRFERQIQFLKKHFKLVSLEHGLDLLDQGQTADQPWLAVTIDDGFRDNYSHAWPILQRHGIPATIFLATDFVDNGRPPWPTQLVEILERTRASVMEAPVRANLTSLASRAAVARRLKEAWSLLPPEQRFDRLSALRRHLRVDEATRYPALTWKQVREMRDAGIRFGSHTVYHSMLSRVDQAVLAVEAMDSKHRIEAELQEPCVKFAYPDGKHDALSRTALESCGYKTALTQDLGCNQDILDQLTLKRIEIPFNDPMPSFRARVSLALPCGDRAHRDHLQRSSPCAE